MVGRGRSFAPGVGEDIGKVVLGCMLNMPSKTEGIKAWELNAVSPWADVQENMLIFCSFQASISLFAPSP